VQLGPCQITLSEGKPDELLRELSAHRVDLMVTNFLPAGVDAKGLSPRSITKKNVAFYASPTFCHLRKDFPQSLSGQPVILPTYDSKLRQDLEHWARIHHVDWDIVTESQDVSVKKLLAMHDLGLMAAAAHTVTRQVKEGTLVEIGVLQGVHEELFLVTAERKIENAIAAKLLTDFMI
jgi:LysR family transcriptional activator of nhaA